MKKTFALLAAVLLAATAGAVDLPEHLSMTLDVKGAYHPESKWTQGWGDARYQFISGPYDGVELAAQLNVNYTIPTPLGDNFLLRSANVVATGSVEVSPVSLKPIAKVAFTPLPFLSFNVRGEAGTGWDLPFLRLHGMAKHVSSSNGNGNGTYGQYTALTPFGDWLLKFAAQGIFQFDTAALWPGDWHHIQMQYTYEVYYENQTGVPDGTARIWQGTASKVDGWGEYQCLVLAYGMPLVISRAGVMVESDRHYFNDFTETKNSPDASIPEISISPMAQFTFNEHNLLSVLFTFANRRHTLETDGDITNGSPKWLWYFKRLAFQYTYTF